MKTEEIVTRLRNKAERVRAPGREVRDMVEWVAADALEAQAREIERLRGLLSEIASREPALIVSKYDPDVECGGCSDIIAIARRAPTPEETEGHE